MRKFVPFLSTVLIGLMFVLPINESMAQSVYELQMLVKEKDKQIERLNKQIKNLQNGRNKNFAELEENMRLLQEENDSLWIVIEDIRAVEKARSEAEANTKLVTINSDIKDPVFLEYLLRYCDMDNDGVLTQWDAEHTYVIDVGRDKSILNVFGSSNQIASIEGIEHFVNLKRLVCSGNNIPRIDLSKNMLLETFIANGCALKTLDGLKNDRLTHLECSNNLLYTLDLKNNPNLQYLDVSNNKMSAIDITGCTKLNTFNCSGNELTSLDVSKNVVLQTLDCSNNRISNLSFTNNTSLDNINCSKNKLTDVDVRNGIVEIKFFDCSKNKELEFVYFSKGCRVLDDNRDVKTYYK